MDKLPIQKSVKHHLYAHTIYNKAMKNQQTLIDNRKVSLQVCSLQHAPLVILIVNHQLVETVQKVCHSLDENQPFHTLCFHDLNWDEDLSPWPHEPIVQKDDHFTGNAPEFLKTVEKAVEWARTIVGPNTYTILSGYSMGGLFSLYAPYNSTQFDAIVCASGSVWYPGFYDYATTHTMKGVPRSIYLSLGRKESQTRNPYLSQTGLFMEKLQKFYKEIHIPCVLEWNPGNHFVNADLRLAKGILWSIEQISK